MTEPDTLSAGKDAGGDGRGAASGAGVSRRGLLKGVGTGAFLAGPAGTPVRLLEGAGVRDRRDGDRPAVQPRSTAAEGPDGVELRPVFGDCRDVFGHGDGCGQRVRYGDSTRDELGTHEYTLLFNGFPTSLVTGGGVPGMVRSTDAITRSPPPSSAEDPSTAVYELTVHGWAFAFEAVHELTVLDWYATCELSPACRDRWCAAFDGTVADLRARRDALDRALVLANARLASQTFSMPGATMGSEEAVLANLRARIGAEVSHQLVEIREDYERFVDEAQADDDRPALDEASLCAACRECDPRFPAYDDVLAWELRWSERVDSTASWIGDGGFPTEGWSNHAVTGRALLERTDPVDQIEVGEMGGIGPLVEGFLRLLVQLFVFVAALGGRRQLFWTATEVEASGWRRNGWMDVSDEGGSGLVMSTVVSGERTEVPEDDLRLMIEPGAAEYELSLTDLEVSGVTSTTTPDGLNSAPTTSFVGSWELIQRLVAGRDTPGFDDVDEPNPYAESGSLPRWELPGAGNCGLELNFAASSDLNGEAVDPFVMVSFNGPEGTADVDWTLVPHTLRAEVPERVDC